MSARQIEVCARRIPNEDDRAEFLRLQAEAAALIRRAVEMRRSAWALYRDATGRRTRKEMEMFR